MDNDLVLQIEHLKKDFKEVHAVEDVSLSVRRGEIFGFLGPNGAGKTTTIGMMLGLIHPTAGSVEVFGHKITPDHTEVLRKVGTLISPPTMTPYLSAYGNLSLLSELYPGLPPGHLEQLLKTVGLGEVGKRRAKKFSTGMKQRLGLALALLNQPDLLILDEPTNGLDAAGIHEIRVLMRTLADQGVTVFLSSHLLHEMELICDRVAVIQQGRIIAQGKVSDLLSTVQEGIHVTTAEPAKTAEVLREIAPASDVQVKAGIVEVRGLSSETVMNYLVQHNLTPKEVSIAHTDLESIFLELTSNPT